jgi:hypothetical protein
MTKEELEKATGQELIDERNYCGVDGYYNDYLDNVNAEMLKRFNRLTELEKENAELKEQVNILDNCDRLGDVITEAYKEQLTKAKELLKRCYDNYIYLQPLRGDIEQFLNSEVENDSSRTS